MANIEIMRKRAQLSRLQAAHLEFEITIAERLADIERVKGLLESNIEAQKKVESEISNMEKGE